MRVTFGPSITGGGVIPMDFGPQQMEATKLFHADGAAFAYGFHTASADRDLVLRAETIPATVSMKVSGLGNLDRLLVSRGFRDSFSVSQSVTQAERRLTAAPFARSRIQFAAPDLLRSSEVFAIGFAFDSRIGKSVMRHSRDSVPSVKYLIRINDEPHEVWTDDPDQIKAISRKRAFRNAQLPQTVLIDGQQQPNPDLDQTDEDFVARLLIDWTASVSGFNENDLNTAAQRIFARLAGKTPEH